MNEIVISDIRTIDENGGSIDDVISYLERECIILPKSVGEVDRIAEGVCHFFNVTESELKSRSRKKDVIKARDYYYYLAYKYTTATLTTIGNKVDRDHATVIHHVDKMSGYVTVGDNDVVETLREIRDFLKLESKTKLN